MSFQGKSCLIAGLVASAISVIVWIGLTVEAGSTAMATDRVEAATTARQIAVGIGQGMLPGELIAGDDQRAQVVADDGRVLSATGDLRGAPPVSMARPRTGDIRWDGLASIQGVEHTIVGMRAPGAMVYVLEKTPELIADPRSAWLLALALLLVVGVVVTVTRWLVGIPAARVRTIMRELEEITAKDTHRRVRVSGGNDEVDQLVATINRTLDRLDNALGQQCRFVADASHELRSPITALRAEIDLALQDAVMGTRASRECATLVEQAETVPLTTGPRTTGFACPGVEAGTGCEQSLLSVDRAANRLQLLVEDLLAVARLDAGMPVDVRRLDLSELVREELARSHPDKTVTTALAERAPVEGDRLQLARVLTNLLNNALRHAASTVSISTSVDAERAEAIISVTDDGSGLSPADRERVFQRFTRLSEGRKRDPGGSGLGLAIAREIATRHSGSLVAEEAPHGGASFVLRLPLCDPES
ncbi:HAMP domain-containing histidine kinase [Nonomuraea sp. NBC_01738]|uniref:sensor histidine kinase n=1 Tax=Nonomuraea sp. NBC_01738 TaxID=2976003 RepID=UPI002E10D92B|nr:HAMP domain-containing histidine kinase [Nonomuraea sp. NBC_01738]